MKMMFQVFAKQLFGAKYERLPRAFLVYVIVFWGLYLSGLRVRIAPFILYFMVSSYTAGVMWQALFSEGNAATMQHVYMLPFERRSLILSYVAALGAYTFLTKTAALLTIVFAVSEWRLTEVFASLLCVFNAILMSAAVFSMRKYRAAGRLWGAGVAVAILFLWNESWFIPAVAVNSVLAFLLLQSADGYSFIFRRQKCGQIVKNDKRYSVWRYFFRYLSDNKNYCINTVIMWGAACMLPLLFGNIETAFVAPIGFAILSMNTPICILLSCDADLEQAVRLLPGQEKGFCVPYCLFIFICNMAADSLFLCSLQIQTGRITILIIITAVFFALLSAVLSVLLEWYRPIRGWKVESDLWHHPRKYVVPVVMILLAGIVGGCYAK
ncbi:MAG: hypothetical protein HFH13_05700 [Dorea sp.]|nr:hypothetical protein [Dorea sp.]